jgi:succinate dehydrogenase / fumarate reductase, cytochrome b subunit
LLDPRINHHKAEPFEHIAHEMRHHGPTTVVYILGTLGVAYHLANGLYSFAMGWGVVSSRRALRRLDVGVIALFLVLLAMSWGVIYALWSAGA